MPRALLSDLSTLFRLEAYALEATDPEESDRLHDVADELAERAVAEEV